MQGDVKTVEVLQAKIAKAFPPELADAAFDRVQQLAKEF
jgi:hypothetical protein